MQRLTHNSGFTLIELSIVLVIIGLISSGVLFGRDLIRAAEVRAQVSQVEKFDAAVMTFRSKYNCIPGDCMNASAYDLGSNNPDGDNGNGNGRLEYNGGASNFNGGIDGLELRNFWVHLGKSNLVSGTFEPGNVPGVNSPSLSMKGSAVSGQTQGGMWLGPLSTGQANSTPQPDAWFLTTTIGGIMLSDSAGVYYPSETFAMDSKIDDGFPTTGRMRSSGNSLSFFGQCSAQFNPATGGFDIFCAGLLDNLGLDTDLACGLDRQDGSPPVYNVINTQYSDRALCAPVIKATF